MGETNLTGNIRVETIPPGQELELKQVNDQGDTMVTLSGRFIGYIKWAQVDEFVDDVKQVYCKYFPNM